MKVLITGGSGLIGKALSKKLLSEGHEVNILTRNVKNSSSVKEFHWDKTSVDPKAFEGVETIVHLAGAGIADKHWTNQRKKEIIDSRVDTLKLIQENYKGDSLKAIIGGSAIGFYGGDTGDIENNEDSEAGEDFMADCCEKWEKAEDDFAKKFELRVVKIRTGVVLDKNDGALPKIINPIKYYAGAAFGSGKQWMSWIHIDDMVEIFFQSIINPNIETIINGVAPYPVTNQEFTKTAAQVLGKKILLPNIPSFILKMILGEMSVVILGSSKVINKQISPIKFKFETLDKALQNLLG
ncbi:TIGR01777 family protein [Lacihabitans sp. LS3-19]|uniref:TIGR01777 family oxidoreductase n=1 Tax=Lacihabitans sp. LS3-19 TaxID=2487335 RepID=UPI0020CBE184|nr:TIGR01777 family oxidoreductase [Lacihabitans sp. LS3-19]MCP9770103.1 TIGR01777 family protein [Lacihabitans sp. LS3-19]